ncbi:MAG: carboxylesterase [Frankiaceae bacterium]|jgi:carboxylesterase|nr:carboxylesterase [Frankiaceae bacterium]MDQ1724127.1 carboxylesterase [Frankiaceae bacterium]
MSPAPRATTLKGARAITIPGDRTGVILCHGYTGTPQSLGAWPERLSKAGFAVECPLLPGHGTVWRDMAKTRWSDWYDAVDAAFVDLQSRCDEVFVMGLSMGGTLALRLAEVHGAEVAGLVLVNPSLTTTRRAAKLAPLLKHLVASTKGPGNDVAKPGVVELAYDRHPLRAFDSLRAFWAIVRGDLHRIDQPLLVFRSANDHVVEPISSKMLLARVSSTDVTEVVLKDSFHVATLDYDAPRIFAASIDFVHRLSRTSSGRGTDAQ